MLYLMLKQRDAWGIDDWQIFIDSPMAVDVTNIFRKYRQYFDQEAWALIDSQQSPLHFPGLHLARTAAQSKEINDEPHPCIIMATSGMCTGGRVVHHLKHNLWRRQSHVIFVGYQAIGTLGRRIVDGAETIKLWGENYPVRARVWTIGGLSAHGDQADLLAWYGAFKGRPPLYLVHGERQAQQVLAEKLRDELAAPVYMAEHAQKISF